MVVIFNLICLVLDHNQYPAPRSVLGMTKVKMSKEDEDASQSGLSTSSTWNIQPNIHLPHLEHSPNIHLPLLEPVLGVGSELRTFHRIRTKW